MGSGAGGSGSGAGDLRIVVECVARGQPRLSLGGIVLRMGRVRRDKGRPALRLPHLQHDAQRREDVEMIDERRLAAHLAEIQPRCG